MLTCAVKISLLMCTILYSRSLRWSIQRAVARTCAFSTKQDCQPAAVFTSISFYKFINIPDDHIDRLIETTKSTIQDLGAKGTLLLTTEGYNGQFAIPAGTLQDFRSGLLAADKHIFSDYQLTHGETIDYSTSNVVFPFKKLVVRRKKEALTDGLVDKDGLDIDWNKAGNELPPQQWHAAVEALQHNKNNAPSPAFSGTSSDVIVPAMILDCRNEYESDAGMFQGAQPLNTRTFGDTWDKLEELLRDTPRDAPVLTYCTGGIRCVKVNAYLQQKMGFTNTHRLEGGIIAYEQWLKHSSSTQLGPTGVDDKPQQAADLEIAALSAEAPRQQQRTNLFLGNNFLFDRRRLTEETNQNN